MRVILIHGKDANPDDKWYPWFKKEIMTKGIEVIIPKLPKANNPIMTEWLSILENLKPDQDTILIGHSRGGVAVLRYLENLPIGTKIKKVILIATNSGLIKHMAIPTESNFGFYTKDGYDFAKIRSHCDNFVVFHSKNDKWVPFAHGQENAKNLNAKFITFDARGHFGINDGIVPGLIEEII